VAARKRPSAGTAKSLLEEKRRSCATRDITTKSSEGLERARDGGCDKVENSEPD